MTRSSSQSGFTLVELMVALAIFGMLSAAGVALFASSVRSQEQVGRRLDALGAEARLSAILAADLGQAVPRIARDSRGAFVPAFSGSNGVGAAPVLAFVRGGVSNPGEQPRGSLQRVQYRLRDGRLERVAFAAVDGSADEQVSVLADRVTRVALRYRDGSAWSSTWQPLDPTVLPRAAELTVEWRDRPPLTMAFLVGPAL